MSDKDKDKKEEEKKEEKKEGEEEEEKEVPEVPIEPIEMKKGDYTVHVLIEESKEWKPVGKNNTPPYQQVRITALGEVKKTEKQKESSPNSIFNEHFYFTRQDMTVEQLDSEKIIIECYDTKNMKKEKYIGIYEFDFEFVYNRPDHAIKNTWVALSNPISGTMEEIKGYIKLSISVLHEDDPRVDLVADDSISNCLVATQAKQKYKQISLYIFRALELPNMDPHLGKGRDADAYVEVNYLGIKRKTKICKLTKIKVWNEDKEGCAIWNQVIDIPVAIPVVSNKIVMYVKDDDYPRKDDVAGSIELKVDDIIKGKYEQLTYVHLYGPQEVNLGGFYDLMNENSEIGSKWNGKVLIKATAVDCEGPVSAIRDLRGGDKAFEEANLLEKENCCSWRLYAKLYEGLYLPYAGDELGVEICIDQYKIEFEKKKTTKERCAEWNQCKDIEVKSVKNAVDELPEVFVYLVYGKKRVCYQRIKPSELRKNEIFVLKMVPDPCGCSKPLLVNKRNIQPMFSGILKLRLLLFNKELDKGRDLDLREITTANPLISFLSSVKDKIKDGLVGNNEGRKNYTVVICVHMSKQLLAADKTGTSDPYVKITVGNQVKQTRVIYSTVNGIWNEKLVFQDLDFLLDKKETYPIFFTQVMDWNRTTDTPMGYCYYWLSQASVTVNSAVSTAKPKWHKLYLPKTNKQQGMVMLRAFILDQEHKGLIDQIEVKPKTSMYSFEVNVLGLRRLKPLSLLPIKKAFVKFNLNSLNVTGEVDNALQNISTTPGDSGTDPTINTIISFDCNLPMDKELMPELQCEVYDHALAGLSNSLLGVFTMDLTSIINITEREIDEDKKISGSKIGLGILGGIKGSDKSMSGFLSNVGRNTIDAFSDSELPEPGKSNKKDTGIIPGLIEDKPSNDTNTISTDSNQNKNDIKIDIGGSNDNVISTDMQNTNEPTDKADLITETEVPSIQKNLIQITKDELLKSLDSPDRFVLLPRIRNYKVPGYPRKVDEEGKKERVQKDFFIEDNADLYEVLKQKYQVIGFLDGIDRDYLDLDQKNIDDLPKFKKHYRRKYGKELEDIREVMDESPFHTSGIRRGKFEDKKKSSELFEQMSNPKAKILVRYGAEAEEERKKTEQEEAEGLLKLKQATITEQPKNIGVVDGQKIYGVFKGVTKIAQQDKMNSYKSKMLEKKDDIISKDFKNWNNYQELKKKMLLKKSIVVRLYILELNNLAQKDKFSADDPYIKIFLNGKEVVNEVKNHQDDVPNNNCDWYQTYDIVTEMPGGATIRIEVWDYNPLIPDSLIGSTTIDIEDRYFNNSFMSLAEKPVETRRLYNEDISGQQGIVTMWMDMFDLEEKSLHPTWQILPEPVQEFQLRCVVWETENMDCMDVEDTSDLYVTATIDMKHKFKTDTHFRCQTGAGSFNWRLLIPVYYNSRNKTGNKLRLSVWDKDLFASDDFICQSEIDLEPMIQACKATKLPVVLTKDFYKSAMLEKDKASRYVDDPQSIESDPGHVEFVDKDDDPEGIKFWLKFVNGDRTCGGRRVMLSMELCPIELVENLKRGEGRDEPNLEPYCPPPTGRISFSLNPCTMIDQCIGPKFRKKCKKWCCIICIAAILIVLVPYLIFGVFIPKGIANIF